jgi:hypothetical protein
MGSESTDIWSRPSARRHGARGLAIVLVVAAGCGPQAPQVEFGNRHYSAALRTAANTRSADRLARTKQLIARDQAAGLIGPEEHAWYQEIITLGEAGRWSDAERRAIQFRRDQHR